MNDVSDTRWDRMVMLIGMIFKVLIVWKAADLWPWEISSYQIIGSIALAIVLVKGTYDYWDWCRIGTLPPL